MIFSCLSAANWTKATTGSNWRSWFLGGRWKKSMERDSRKNQGETGCIGSYSTRRLDHQGTSGNQWPRNSSTLSVSFRRKLPSITHSCRIFVKDWTRKWSTRLMNGSSWRNRMITMMVNRLKTLQTKPILARNRLKHRRTKLNCPKRASPIQRTCPYSIKLVKSWNAWLMVMNLVSSFSPFFRWLVQAFIRPIAV